MRVSAAWTDPAKVSLIPLPVVQPQLTVEPPAYARRLTAPANETNRQLSALEGAKLTFSVASVNHKELTAVWLTVKTKAGALELPPGKVWVELVPADGGDVSITKF